MGGGILAVLLITVGAWVALTQMGGQSGASAALSVTTTPAEATVLVDGDTAGTTPLRDYALGAGPVTLRVQKNGRQPVDTSLTIEAGDRVALLGIALARTPSGRDDAPQTVDAPTEAPTGDSPTGAESAAGTADRDPTETTSSSSNPSTAPASGAADRSEEAGAPDASATGTTSATGRVQAAAQPVGTVLVDGEEQSGGGPVEIAAGPHTITCRHPQGGATDTTVTVAKGQTHSLTCYTKQTVNVNTKGPFGRIWLNGSDTGKNTNAGGSLSLPPGTHQIEVRRRSIDDYRVNGGMVKVRRGGDSRTKSFSGASYRVEVRPTFEKVEHAILFNVGGT